MKALVRSRRGWASTSPASGRRDPEGGQLEGIRDQDHPGLGPLGPPAGVEAGGDHVAVGRQGERDPGAGQEVAGHAVDPDRRRVDGADEPVGGQVGQADPQGVAAGLGREVEHGQAGDDRAGQVGHRLDALAADDVGVEPGPAVVLAQLAHDQDVDLVERQAGHQAACLVEQAGLDVEQLLGLDRDDPGGLLARRSRAGPRRARPGSARAGRRRPRGASLQEPRQAELVDLGGPLALAQADREHLEQAALVPSGERGVRLDPVEQDDAVGLVGVAVEVDRQAEGVGAEADRVHLGSGSGSRRRPR